MSHNYKSNKQFAARDTCCYSKYLSINSETNSAFLASCTVQISERDIDLYSVGCVSR